MLERGSAQFIDTVFGTLSFRKLYHIAGGAVMLGALLLLDDLWLFVLGSLYVLAFWVWGRRISFAVIALLVLLGVTRSRFAALGAAIIFTFGDGAAAIIGSKYGRQTLPWHERKTFLGSFAFLIFSLAGMWTFIALSVTPGWFKAWPLIVIPALVGCVVECLPFNLVRDRKADDNLLLILACGLSIHVIQLKINGLWALAN